jgi:hypothetical protein
MCVKSGVHPAEAQGSFGTRPFGPQPPQDIPRGLENAKKFGREFLPPPGA